MANRQTNGEENIADNPVDATVTKRGHGIENLGYKQGPRNHGVQRGAAAAPPDFENPKKLSHKNAIKLDFSEKWGQNWPFGPP